MLQAFGITDPGIVRKSNEDGFLCRDDLRLFAVADGMGGHSAGEVASGLALESLETFIARSSVDDDFSWPYGIDPELSFDANRLRTAVNLANRRVFRAAESHDEYTGMGTTLTAVLVEGPVATFGHVGDSRLYLLRHGCVRQLTQDDSWIAMVLAHNPGTKPADLAHHPMRHVLVNVIGAREQVDSQVGECRMEKGDRLLVCSDGLHGVVEDGDLQALLSRDADVATLAHALVKTANERGGPDNITAVLMQYDE